MSRTGDSNENERGDGNSDTSVNVRLRMPRNCLGKTMGSLHEKGDGSRSGSQEKP